MTQVKRFMVRVISMTLGLIFSMFSMDCSIARMDLRISSISPSISGAISAPGHAVLSRRMMALDISPKFLNPSVHMGCPSEFVLRGASRMLPANNSRGLRSNARDTHRGRCAFPAQQSKPG